MIADSRSFARVLTAAAAGRRALPRQATWLNAPSRDGGEKAGMSCVFPGGQCWKCPPRRQKIIGKAECGSLRIAPSEAIRKRGEPALVLGGPRDARKVKPSPSSMPGDFSQGGCASSFLWRRDQGKGTKRWQFGGFLADCLRFVETRQLSLCPKKAIDYSRLDHLCCVGGFIVPKLETESC